MIICNDSKTIVGIQPESQLCVCNNLVGISESEVDTEGNVIDKIIKFLFHRRYNTVEGEIIS